MSREQRSYVLDKVQSQIWDGWERGLSINEITRVLPTRRISVSSIIHGYGGRIDWSPHQISGWLKRAYPEDATMRVSHETIYRTLFIKARGVLRPRLTDHLRRGQCVRIPRAARHPATRSRIPDAVCINERPVQVEDRAIPGHWEGDLLCGDHSSQIATLAERQSRFVKLVKVETKCTNDVVAASSKHMLELPTSMRRSLTWDRGIEMTNHKTLTNATKTDIAHEVRASAP